MPCILYNSCKNYSKVYNNLTLSEMFTLCVYVYLYVYPSIIDFLASRSNGKLSALCLAVSVELLSYWLSKLDIWVLTKVLTTTKFLE